MTGQKKRTFSGDSLIEVLLGITVFSAVAVGGIAIMNSGLNQAQRSLEITMARNEIDAQAEALRFIHNNYIAERELTQDKWQFTDLWNKIVSTTINPQDIMSIKTLNLNNADSCEEAYREQFDGTKRRTPFIINPRFVQPRGILMGNDAQQKYLENVLPEIVIASPDTAYNESTAKFKPASTYPRLIYGYLHVNGTPINDAELWDYINNSNNDDTMSENVSKSSTKLYYRKLESAEGIWVLGVRGDNDNRSQNNDGNAEFYDFYIRSCWNSTGMNTHSTITTTVRLYNPGVID